MKKDIFEATERLLATRAHSVHELTRKLLKKFPDEKGEIDNCVNYFINSGIVNDEAFARDYAEYIIRTHPKGLFMLKHELLKKGITEPLLSKTLSGLEIDEAGMAQKLAEQKLQTLSAILDKQKKMEKIYRFLLSRGFPFDIAQRTARGITDNSGT